MNPAFFPGRYAPLLALLLLPGCASEPCGDCSEALSSGGAGGTPTSPPVTPSAGGSATPSSDTNDPSNTSGGAPSSAGTGGESTDTAGSDGSETSTGETSSQTGTSGETTEPSAVSREFLSQTGLYADIASETLAPGVQPYTPQFELWTDGAEKRRWVYIPEGTQIDTSDIDDWKFPIGTKIWKEFSRDGIRIETRLIEKLPRERAREGFEGWLSIAYVWLDDQSDAAATPEGLENAKGTAHDVPAQDACGDCHDMRVEKPLGFSAIQLAHEGEGLTLTSLAEQELISDPPSVDLTVPGTDEQRELLGYFHANCGHCHRERAAASVRVGSLQLWLESDALASFEASNAYQSLVNHNTESGHGSIHPYRIYGGDPDQSELMRRLLFRVDGEDVPPAQQTTDTEVELEDVPMPPLGTEVAFESAVTAIRAWIESLPPPSPEL